MDGAKPGGPGTAVGGPSDIGSADAGSIESGSADAETTDDDPLLSVVVVTYNEADRIAACLEGIFAACRSVPTFEVIVVDSNSTDETVRIAGEYDVTILEITDDALTTPAAGRYVGTHRARGDYLLFVDGDIELVDGGWIVEGIERLQADPSLAGVDGYLDEREREDSTPVEYLHGVALYDREALSAVGGYHPFLEAWEDVDLGFELQLAGYELRRLPAVTGVHPDAGSPLEQLRRWRRGYYRAGGQVCAKAGSRPPLLAKWLRFFADKLGASGWLALGAVVLVLRPAYVLAWLAATLVGAALLCARMGVENGLQRGLSFLLFPAGFAVGFRRVPSRSAFPDDVVATVAESTGREAKAPRTD